MGGECATMCVFDENKNPKPFETDDDSDHEYVSSDSESGDVYEYDSNEGDNDDDDSSSTSSEDDDDDDETEEEEEEIIAIKPKKKTSSKRKSNAKSIKNHQHQIASKKKEKEKEKEKQKQLQLKKEKNMINQKTKKINPDTFEQQLISSLHDNRNNNNRKPHHIRATSTSNSSKSQSKSGSYMFEMEMVESDDDDTIKSQLLDDVDNFSHESQKGASPRSISHSDDIDEENDENSVIYTGYNENVSIQSINNQSDNRSVISHHQSVPFFAQNNQSRRSISSRSGSHNSLHLISAFLQQQSVPPTPQTPFQVTTPYQQAIPAPNELHHGRSKSAVNLMPNLANIATNSEPYARSNILPPQQSQQGRQLNEQQIYNKLNIVLGLPTFAGDSIHSTPQSNLSKSTQQSDISLNATRLPMLPYVQHSHQSHQSHQPRSRQTVTVRRSHHKSSYSADLGVDTNWNRHSHEKPKNLTKANRHKFTKKEIEQKTIAMKKQLDYLHSQDKSNWITKSDEIQ